MTRKFDKKINFNKAEESHNKMSDLAQIFFKTAATASALQRPQPFGLSEKDQKEYQKWRTESIEEVTQGIEDIATAFGITILICGTGEPE